MSDPTGFEYFRRGASYWAKQRPPRLSSEALGLMIAWFGTLLFSYLLIGPIMLTRPGLIIWACVMAPGTILRIVKFINRWRRNGPPV